MNDKNNPIVSRDLLLGRRAIAQAAERSPRTITRWAQAGRLTVAKVGESRNNLMVARRSDVDKVR